MSRGICPGGRGGVGGGFFLLLTVIRFGSHSFGLSILLSLPLLLLAHVWLLCSVELMPFGGQMSARVREERGVGREGGREGRKEGKTQRQEAGRERHRE